MQIELDTVYNCDCLDLMREMARGGVRADWVITDPPYGISVNNNMGRRKGDKASDYKDAYWDKERLSKDYFDLMLAVADKHIIFGGNYYTDYLPPSKSWLVWDKCMSDELTFSQVELAWTDADCMAKLVRQFPNNGEKRYHPTQKPLQVIEWIISKYTKKGDIILDPFGGVFTTAVACHKLQRHYICCELDKDYYQMGLERLNRAKAQISIFDLIDQNNIQPKGIINA